MHIYILKFSPLFALDDDDVDDEKENIVVVCMDFVGISFKSSFSFQFICCCAYGSPLCILGINVINAENEYHQYIYKRLNIHNHCMRQKTLCYMKFCIYKQ